MYSYNGERPSLYTKYLPYLVIILTLLLLFQFTVMHSITYLHKLLLLILIYTFHNYYKHLLHAQPHCFTMLSNHLATGQLKYFITLLFVIEKPFDVLSVHRDYAIMSLNIATFAVAPY